MTATAPAMPRIVWRWSHAVLGAAYALPAAIVSRSNVENGLALLVSAIATGASARLVLVD